ncbi:oxidoreductase [Opitutaceae bacterium EW11]|nr:oxidoreductase [Opitutaceae bacterium EW11]
MNIDLTGKTALVSGSTAGIGLAIAAELAQRGASVVINGRTAERVAAAEQAILNAVPQAKLRGIAADLGTAEGCAALVNMVPDVDVLVNNLGIFEPKPFEQIPDADWFRFFEVNVMSGVRLSRAYMGRMREQKWGRVIFISSESAVQIPVEMIHYGMTKTAQAAVARGLAETTVNTAVTVNSILVGPTASEGVQDFVGSLARAGGKTPEETELEFFKTARPSSLLQRFILPSEVAAMVAFVCSPAASAVNGAALRVDGGVVRAVF